MESHLANFKTGPASWQERSLCNFVHQKWKSSSEKHDCPINPACFNAAVLKSCEYSEWDCV